MLEEIKNIKSEKSDLRKFGITFGIGWEQPANKLDITTFNEN